MPQAPIGRTRRLLQFIANPSGFLTTMGVAALAWLGIAFGVIPTMIRRAHAGVGPALLQRLMSGRDTVPVDAYLQVWAGIARTATVGAVVIGVVGAMLLWKRTTLTAWGRRAGQHLGLWGGAPLSPVDFLAMTVAIATAGGLFEAAVVLARQRFTAFPGWPYTHDVVWMAPSAAAALFLAAGVVWLAISRPAPSLRGFRVVTLLLVTAALYAGLRTGLSRLYPWANLLLAGGVAVRLTGVLAARRRRFLVWSRRVAVLAPFAVGAIAALTVRRAGSDERRARAEPVSVTAAARPNVMLLVFDTVRAAALGTYGHSRVTSPNLDTLAAEGVTFDWALASAPWTLASHATIFTGYHYHNVTWDRPLQWSAPTLAEVLSAEGYLTGGFMANPHYGTEYYGLQRGFHRYIARPTTWLTWIQSTRYTYALANTVLGWFGPQAALIERRRADEINGEFFSWLDDRPADRPFFGFLNYIDAHDPYLPPHPYELRFADRMERYRLSIRGHEYTPEEIAELLNMYDASVAYDDAALGRLVDGLRERGLLDNTILIVTSDHGEEFGEHGVMGHSMSMYLPSLHVPLVIRYPAGVPAGRRVPTPIGLRNVPATITDLIGLDGTRFPGVSLQRAWTEPGVSPDPILAHLIEKAERIPDRYPAAGGEMHTLFLDGYQYIESASGKVELYEYQSDPWERQDLAGDPDRRRILERARATLHRLAPEREEPGLAAEARVGATRRLGGG